MKRKIVFLWLAAPLLLFGQEKFRLTIAPLDLHGSEKVYLRSLGQIEYDGENLYLRSIQHTEILVVRPDGSFVKAIGGQGGHPSEFGDIGVMALSVRGPDLWAIDAQLRLVRHFSEGEFLGCFPIPSFNVHYNFPTTNLFAFSEDRVVVPCAPEKGALAEVFDWEGNPLGFAGEPLMEARDLAPHIPGIDDTFWIHEADRWYSIHKFFPIITVYNQQLEAIDQFRVRSPFIQERFDAIQGFVPNEAFSIPPPIFTDVKFYRGSLYLMCKGRLHQVSAKSGGLQSIAEFIGRGPDFAGLPSPRVTLFFFSILKDGTLVLGHPGLLWNHDLWTATLPGASSPKNAKML